MCNQNQGREKKPNKNGTFFQIHHKYSEHHCALKAQLASTPFNPSLLELVPSCAAGISSGTGPMAIPAACANLRRTASSRKTGNITDLVWKQRTQPVVSQKARKFTVK